MTSADELTVDENDWFGEGSSFDSGEELAAALLSMGAPRQPEGAGPVAAPKPPQSTVPTPAAPSAAAAPAGAAGGLDPSAWPTITVDPAPAPVAPPSGQRSGAGWRMRQGVRSLRLAEQALERLREDAVLVAWAAAAVAVREARRDP